MKKGYNKNAIKDYESAKDKTIFRKTLFDMSTDYEFNNSYDNPFIKDNVRLYLPSFSRYSLYFNKINNQKCKEIITGLIFVRQNDDVFYNNESGIYFELNNYFERAVGHEKIIKTKEYLLFVCNYFNYFINLKNEDDKLRSNGISLMLKNNIKYGKKEK